MALVCKRPVNLLAAVERKVPRLAGQDGGGRPLLQRHHRNHELPHEAVLLGQLRGSTEFDGGEPPNLIILSFRRPLEVLGGHVWILPELRDPGLKASLVNGQGIRWGLVRLSDCLRSPVVLGAVSLTSLLDVLRQEQVSPCSDRLRTGS